MEDQNLEEAYYKVYKDQIDKAIKECGPFEPKPFLYDGQPVSSSNNCSTGDPFEQDCFLISEYGIDTYLRVKNEEKQSENLFKKFAESLKQYQQKTGDEITFDNFDKEEGWRWFVLFMLFVLFWKGDDHNEQQ